jgi:hypothetical protein
VKMSKLNLFNALEASYKSVPDAKKVLAKYDYYVNEELSTPDIKVAWNPVTKKLIILGAGSHKKSDIITDVYLAAGKLKNTTRYKEAEAVLKKAKEAYRVDNATIVGHSLFGTIASYIGSKKDKVITYNKGATIGQGSRSNETAYRSKGDLVSVLASGNKNMKTLAPSVQQDLSGFSGRQTHSLFQPHDLSNLSRAGNQNIFLEQTKAEPTAMPINQQVYQGSQTLRREPEKRISNPVVATQGLRGMRGMRGMREEL